MSNIDLTRMQSPGVSICAGSEGRISINETHSESCFVSEPGSIEDYNQAPIEPIQPMHTTNFEIIHVFHKLLLVWLQLGKSFGSGPDKVDFKRGLQLIFQYEAYIGGIELTNSELYPIQFVEHFRELKSKLTKESWQFHRRCVLATIPKIAELSKEEITEILDAD